MWCSQIGSKIIRWSANEVPGPSWRPNLPDLADTGGQRFRREGMEVAVDLSPPGPQQTAAMAIAPDSAWLATGSDDCTVRSWDPITGAKPGPVECDAARVAGPGYLGLPRSAR